MNQLCLSVTLQEREALRYTPAGVPVLSAMVMHQSEQEEAGGMRLVELVMPVIAIDHLARRLNQVTLGSPLMVKGFLAPRRRQAKSLILHLCALESLEGVAQLSKIDTTKCVSI